MGAPFSESYLGKLRARIGRELVLVPGVRMVVEDEKGRILLIRRADTGKWALPAGHPEPGESIEDCIRREVREEAGVEVGEVGYFGYSSDPAFETHVYPNGDQTQSFALLTYSTDWSGTPRADQEESLESSFFAREDFPESASFAANEYRSIQWYFEFKLTGAFRGG